MKKKINKTAFVLDLGNDMSAADVIARAKKAGFKITDRYVYSVRSKAKMQKANGQPRRGLGRPPKSASNSHSRTTAEQQFTDLILDIGLARATKLLENVRRAVS